MSAGSTGNGLATRGKTTLANWRIPPQSAWAFHHVRELIPTAEIGVDQGSPWPRSADALKSDDLSFLGPDGKEWTLDDLLAETATDAFLVARNGEILTERYADHYDPARPHILFSVSKSITAILIGCLVDDGLFSADDPVLSIMPEMAGSAYADCSIRHLLDMTVSMDLTEDYTDPEGDYMRYREATGWNPTTAPSDLMTFLKSIRRGEGPHGTVFRYRSPNTDLLGLIAERAAGIPLSELLSDRIWRKIGCETPADITVDRLGAPRAAGGMSATARDLARIGELMRGLGTVTNRRIVSQDWIRDIVTEGDREAWLQGDYGYLIPDGRYRSQWYQLGGPNGAFCAIGIHGQWLIVDPAAALVVVKFSSQADPVDDMRDQALMAGIATLAQHYVNR
ncbi:MAG: serine hydrolase [Pseudomonadota bacterium]